MKKLRFIILLSIFAIFALGNSNAQPPKETSTTTYGVCYDLLCVGEEICGDVEVTVTYWSNKFQMRLNGTLEGSDSHDIYTVTSTANGKTKPWNEGLTDNSTETVTLSILLEGVVVATVHATVHETVNANGEHIVYMDKEMYTCGE